MLHTAMRPDTIPEPQGVMNVLVPYEKLTPEGARVIGSRLESRTVRLWEDGHLRHEHDFLQAPFSDHYRRLIVQREFLVQAIAVESKEFNEIRKSCLEKALVHQRNPNLPPGVNEHIAKTLTDIRGRVLEWRHRLRKVEEVIAATPQRQAARAEQQKREELAREQYDPFRKWFDLVNNLTLD